jgi:hypothetical protein
MADPPGGSYRPDGVEPLVGIITSSIAMRYTTYETH